MWRISSTLFSHLRHDVNLTPLKEMEHLHDKKMVDAGMYPSMNAQEKLMQELEAISLAPK